MTTDTVNALIGALIALLLILIPGIVYFVIIP